MTEAPHNIVGIDETDRLPTIHHADIARRAYSLWEQRGRVHGRDLDDWLQAEREVKEAEAVTPEEQTRRTGHLVLYLPFLRLKTEHAVAGTAFLPLRCGDGKVWPQLSAAEKPVMKILTGYMDRHRRTFDNCVVATIPGRGWDVNLTDGPTVMWAAQLLFLSSWACNEYFARFGGTYVNSSSFRVIGQAFSGDVPGFIALGARRRDGRSLDGGYEHGDVQFNLPLQCSVNDVAQVDEAFLAALGKAHSANSATIQRLRTALPFVQLANTDDELMDEDAEPILMGSAFEQLLNGDGSAYKLGRKFGQLLKDCGGVTVDDARKNRPDIQIDNDPKYPERAKAQPTWWVHRKWVEELYDLRSKVVHEGGGGGGSRKWGWSASEHLVMAAFVFPLTVKALLAAEGHYTLTEADKARCAAIDRLLAATNWGHDDPTTSDGPTWHKIVFESKLDADFDKRLSEFLKRHPHFFKDNNEEESDSTGASG
jgi:hypothetical protein